jgi:hypothetical protein
MDFSNLVNNLEAKCLPHEILEAAKKRAGYFSVFYMKQGLEVGDFLGDLYLAWVENPDMEPDTLVSKLNSKIRRDNLQDHIIKSKMTADFFYDSKNQNEEDDGPAIDSEFEEMEDLQILGKAEDEMQEIMDFAMSKFGLGLKRKTVVDYIKNDMQGFIALAKTGIAEYKKSGSRWRGFSKPRKGKGRPATFVLSGFSQQIEDPFSPKKGAYYKSPDHYNELRKVRRDRAKNIKENQIQLALI